MSDLQPQFPSEMEDIALDVNIFTELFCYNCGRSFESYPEGSNDVETWAHDVVLRAKQMGWQYIDGEIYCPDYQIEKDKSDDSKTA
jgi:hypothetical protein